MKNSLKDAVVVVTGASSGIGRAAALEFARRGAKVVLAARWEEGLEAAADECRLQGAEVLVVPTDVADEHAVEVLADAAVERFGRIDVWVNNAGVTAFGTFEQIPSEDFRKVIETDLFGYVHGSRAALREFRKRDRGVIINVASAVGKAAQPLTSAYVASKFAIVGFSECLRQELTGDGGIDVCVILPAAVDTPLFQHGANYTGRGIQPMKPLYRPEMVASIIADAAEDPKREIFAGSAARLFHLMHQFAPSLTERIVAHQVKSKHLADNFAPLTAGNLYEPIARYAQTHGGWSNGRDRRLPRLAATAAVLGASGLAVALLLNRASRG